MRLFRRWWKTAADIPISDVADGTSHSKSNLILSFPKSGRTWLSYLYAYYACYYIAGPDADDFIEREFTPTAHIYRPLEHAALMPRLQRADTPLPPIRLSHHYDVTPYYQLDLALSKIGSRRVAFLVRDPRDVVVSYFYHTMQRAEETRARGKSTPADDVDLSEFIRSESYGIRAIVAYMNQVVERGPAHFDAFHMVSYEDLVAQPEQRFTSLLQFFGAGIDPDAVRSAVSRASFENLQRIEIQRRTRKEGNAPPPDALRFRRGQPGAYRSEVEPDDRAYLDRVIQRHLNPAFGRYLIASN